MVLSSSGGGGRWLARVLLWRKKGGLYSSTPELGETNSELGVVCARESVRGGKGYSLLFVSYWMFGWVMRSLSRWEESGEVFGSVGGGLWIRQGRIGCLEDGDASVVERVWGGLGVSAADGKLVVSPYC